MSTLRRAHFLVRLVLAWFVLSLGAAIASPIVNPQGMELICSATGGAKLLVKSDDGSGQAGPHSLDCPLCLIGSALPPPPDTAVSRLESFAARPAPAWRDAPIALHSAAPPPSRGPPSIA